MHKRFLTASLTRLVQAALLAGLASTASAAPVRIDYTGGFTTYAVQTSGTYQIFAFGAQGGNQRSSAGGLGAGVESDFLLAAGQVLSIGVGGMGNASRSALGGGGGGGGTFLILDGTVLLVSGGGGGFAGPVNNGQAGGQAGTSGAAGGNAGDAANLGEGGTNGSGGEANASNGGGGGGGGVLTNGGGNGSGGGGGRSLANGLAGGLSDFGGGNGGFGGGGGGGFAGGAAGGGGYSGGGGARQGNGGGGGSYSSGLLNDDLAFLSGVNAGNGYLTLELLPEAVMGVPEPGSLALFGTGVIGLVATRRKTRQG